MSQKVLVMVTFPRNIYQVWYQGCDKIPRKEFIENAKNWKSLNPTWKYQCVCYEDMKRVAYAYSKRCGRLYESLPIMHMQIDLGRYLLVYMYGGLYVDMDAYAMRSINYEPSIMNMIQDYESTGRPVLAITKANASWLESVFSGTVYNNAFMVSSPKNPCLGRYIDMVIESCENLLSKKSYNEFSMIQDTTGPVKYSTFFKGQHHDSTIVILPNKIIEPCDFTKVCNIEVETIAVHQFELSWIKTPWMKSAIGAYGHAKANMATLFMIIALSLAVYVVYQYMYPSYAHCPVPPTTPLARRKFLSTQR